MTERSKEEELDRFSITVQPGLKAEVDRLAKRLQMNRSSLVRLALIQAIKHPNCLIQNGDVPHQPTAA